MGIFEKIFGSKNAREIKKLQPLVDHINGMHQQFEDMTDAELKAMTPVFRQRIDNGESLDSLMPEVFALVREVSWRVLHMRHFDVQLIGGSVLHSGKIAEMRTGEGKTLVATLPCYLNALSGEGVHVVTVNDYLARRDSEWMGMVYNWLGLSVGVVLHGLSDIERQQAYRSDITYGQNNEFGFDYLRDNMKMSPDRMTQRALNYAVVDEVDSILIDEARTPLIISGPAEDSADLYTTIDRIIPRLKRDIDYTVDEKAHSAMLTDSGVERVENLLELTNLYDSRNIRFVHHVAQALRAHTLYKRDVSYLIDEGKILIIDEHTGRKMPGRRWSDGLHQAIEAKEGVNIEEENQTLATITFQNFFRMYDKLSGMTGTADTEAAEFHQIYKLEVLVIPTNKPIARADGADLVYKNEKGKFRAVIDDITEAHERGQPVLVGTVSVEKSEVLATVLKKQGIKFDVLNAKNHTREALIVAQAGRKGSITISTSMAGRGTDIVLGGNAEALAHAEHENEVRTLEQEYEAERERKRKAKAKALAKARAKKGASVRANREPVSADDDQEGDGPYRDNALPKAGEGARYEEILARYETQCSAEREEVLAAGGLRIVGTERHESRRIDNQLRGRAGRQGDPGASQFYLSLDDDLMRVFGGDKIKGLMDRLGMEDDVPIEHSWVTKSIENAQKKVEGQNFDQRKNVLEYDDVMNQQRKTIYGLRRQILEGRYEPTLPEEDIKAGKVPEPPVVSGDWTVDELRTELRDEIESMVARVMDALALRDQVEGLDDDDEDEDEELPPWRILRQEIWRQTGAQCELERRMDLPRQEIVDYVVETVARSQIQQRERLFDLCDTLIGMHVDTHCPAGTTEDEWDLKGLEEALRDQFGIEPKFKKSGQTPERLAQAMWKQVEVRVDEREKELTRSFLLYFTRHFFLEEIDNQWIDHLKAMDHLREGIYLRGYGQKDPKKEYKKEGFDLFGQMMNNMQVNVGRNIFHVQIAREEEEEIPELRAKQREMHAVHPAAGSDEGGESSAYGDAADGGHVAPKKQGTVRRDRPKVGRNDPCPCGSGKKYKKCHGRPGAEATL